MIYDTETGNIETADEFVKIVRKRFKEQEITSKLSNSSLERIFEHFEEYYYDMEKELDYFDFAATWKEYVNFNEYAKDHPYFELSKYTGADGSIDTEEAYEEIADHAWVILENGDGFIVQDSY